MKVPEHLHAHVVHDLLPGVLQNVRLGGSADEPDQKQHDINNGYCRKPVNVSSLNVLVDRDLGEPRERDLQR